jgi:hypothetical protein
VINRYAKLQIDDTGSQLSMVFLLLLLCARCASIDLAPSTVDKAMAAVHRAVRALTSIAKSKVRNKTDLYRKPMGEKKRLNSRTKASGPCLQLKKKESVFAYSKRFCINRPFHQRKGVVLQRHRE